MSLIGSKQPIWSGTVAELAAFGEAVITGCEVLVSGTERHAVIIGVTDDGRIGLLFDPPHTGGPKHEASFSGGYIVVLVAPPAFAAALRAREAKPALAWLPARGIEDLPVGARVRVRGHEPKAGVEFTVDHVSTEAPGEWVSVKTGIDDRLYFGPSLGPASQFENLLVERAPDFVSPDFATLEQRASVCGEKSSDFDVACVLAGEHNGPHRNGTPIAGALGYPWYPYCWGGFNPGWRCAAAQDTTVIHGRVRCSLAIRHDGPHQAWRDTKIIVEWPDDQRDDCSVCGSATGLVAPGICGACRDAMMRHPCGDVNSHRREPMGCVRDAGHEGPHGDGVVSWTSAAEWNVASAPAAMPTERDATRDLGQVAYEEAGEPGSVTSWLCATDRHDYCANRNRFECLCPCACHRTRPDADALALLEKERCTTPGCVHPAKHREVCTLDCGCRADQHAPGRHPREINVTSPEFAAMVKRQKRRGTPKPPRPPEVFDQVVQRYRAGNHARRGESRWVSEEAHAQCRSYATPFDHPDALGRPGDRGVTCPGPEPKGCGAWDPERTDTLPDADRRCVGFE